MLDVQEKEKPSEAPTSRCCSVKGTGGSEGGKEVGGGGFKSGVGDGRYEGMKGGIGGMVGEVKKVSMGEVGGGALAMRLIDLRVGFGGEGLVVDGGRSPNISRKEGDVGGVAKVSSTGSKEIATREVSLEG
ncbi:hypothetical protein Tco_0098722 [Tanacetum coccineum]